MTFCPNSHLDNADDNKYLEQREAKHKITIQRAKHADTLTKLVISTMYILVNMRHLQTFRLCIGNVWLHNGSPIERTIDFSGATEGIELTERDYFHYVNNASDQRMIIQLQV